MTLYRVVRFFVTGFVRTVLRLEIVGAENIPASGGCILAPSHRSMWDIVVLACTTKRRIHFMGKREVFDWPVIGQVFPKLGAVPVERDGDDRAALRVGMKVLAEDREPLALYPEGTRQQGPKIADLQPGAAYLAIRAGVPVVPISMAGTEEVNHRPDGTKRRLLRPGKVVVLIGKPMEPPDRQGKPVKRALVDAMVADMRVELQDLFDRAYAQRGR